MLGREYDISSATHEDLIHRLAHLPIDLEDFFLLGTIAELLALVPRLCDTCKRTIASLAIVLPSANPVLPCGFGPLPSSRPFSRWSLELVVRVEPDIDLVFVVISQGFCLVCLCILLDFYLIGWNGASWNMMMANWTQGVSQLYLLVACGAMLLLQIFIALSDFREWFGIWFVFDAFTYSAQLRCCIPAITRAHI